MKLVYLDREMGYTDINEKWIATPEAIIEYFGSSYGLEQCMNSNNELIIYELKPYKVIKKDITFKIEEI